MTVTGGCGRILCWEYAFWSSYKNLFKSGRAKCICEITICTCSEESFLILYLAAKISREPPEQLGAVPYPQADQTAAQDVSVKCGMGRAFPRRGRFQPYGWTCEWHKIDVIILSKSTDSISRDWTRVFATAFASQAKFRGGGAVRLFAINSEWCRSLNTSLIWVRFVVCFVWTDTALIFLLQRRNHPRHSEHRTFPPTFPTPWFLERQQHQPVSCPSKTDVLVWSKKKTSLLRDRGAILAQGWSKQDLSFASHSPRCVDTCSGQQRGILPDWPQRDKCSNAVK